MRLRDIPVGESFFVSVDGEGRQYKTFNNAMRRYNDLVALGEEPTIATYVREDRVFTPGTPPTSPVTRVTN